MNALEDAARSAGLGIKTARHRLSHFSVLEKRVAARNDCENAKENRERETRGMRNILQCRMRARAYDVSFSAQLEPRKHTW